jgi:DNA (cytosine-5)-methyltransferase 1
MSKPVLLDLFSGAGGAAMGYARAGFEVIGVDIRPLPRYPFRFLQADALTYLDTADLSQFAGIHASPPCERYTMMLRNSLTRRERHPDLLAATRERLQATGKPYIIENVPSAPIEHSVLLCGAMFGFRVYRHRWFESNLLLFQPAHPPHRAKVAHASTIPGPGEFWCVVGKFGKQDEAQRAMGIDWMQTGVHHALEIAQAIPPAYTEWVGRQLIEVLLCRE